MIEISNLQKFYGSTQILHDINLNVAKGEFTLSWDTAVRANRPCFAA